MSPDLDFFLLTLICVQDVNVSNAFSKGLVGLQVNLTHLDKAKEMKKKYEHGRKEMSEVTWICRPGGDGIVDVAVYLKKKSESKATLKAILIYILRGGLQSLSSDFWRLK